MMLTSGPRTKRASHCAIP